MHTLTAADFLRRAAEVGVGFHPDYPHSNSPTFLPLGGRSVFWERPEDEAAVPAFLITLLDGLDEWEAGYLWPRCGRWSVYKPTAYAARIASVSALRDVVQAGGCAGAVRVGHDDRPVVVAALAVSSVFGGDVTDDLYFLPDHGRQLLMASHHDVVHVHCRSEERMWAFEDHMDAAGYDLGYGPLD